MVGCFVVLEDRVVGCGSECCFAQRSFFPVQWVGRLGEKVAKVSPPVAPLVERQNGGKTLPKLRRRYVEY